MKICKLRTHKREYFAEDLMLNPPDFPDIQENQVLEIFDPKDTDNSRLLLGYRSLKKEDSQKPDKDTISIATDVAESFHLRPFIDVNVTEINSKDVNIDLLELIYKDQYFSRADMWRLKNHLVGRCVYLKKKIYDFACMRTQVNELWSRGEQVTCGVVTDETRVTFRSSTAQVNIFIQMSQEMWEFDNYGDLYFEKAVDGFLVDLFGLWTKKNCNHDVTITMFSRTFYDASSIDEFPIHMRECITKDYRGRYYEDFYRVVVQNERYDEWSNTLRTLKQLFYEYEDNVCKFHNSTAAPLAWNSTSDQGNLLEVLNMGLNVFEKSYLDRNFDRTGMLSIVITPGTGVFEVDRELTNITKQRTIDCGNGSDLVCMGEQPLHAVPLFKFHNKNPGCSLDVGDDYNIPHWINHSFYTSQLQAEKISKNVFIPRLKILSPIETTKDRMSSNETVCDLSINNQHSSKTDDFPFVDFDAYDAQVFALPSNSNYNKTCRACSTIETNHTQNCKCCTKRANSSTKHRRPKNQPQSAELTSSPSSSVLSTSLNESSGINIPRVNRRCRDDYYSSSYEYSPSDEKKLSLLTDLSVHSRPVVGSASNATTKSKSYNFNHYKPHRALINPFAPSRLHFKITSNRRRWAHAYPTDLHGASHQPHHQHSSSSISEPSYYHSPCSTSDSTLQQAEISSHPDYVQPTFPRRRGTSQRISECSDTGDSTFRFKVPLISTSSCQENDVESSCEFRPVYESVSSTDIKHASGLASASGSTRFDNPIEINTSSSLKLKPASSSIGGRSPSINKDIGKWGGSTKEHNWVWGMTGEQEWTPDLTTGMDWKSMTMPASLPITTDYFPDKRSIQNLYVVSNYSLLTEIMDDLKPSGGIARRAQTADEVYHQLVAQRLAQGFQLVVLPKNHYIYSLNSNQRLLNRSSKQTEPEEIEHILSIGRIFHKLTLNGTGIHVKRYWPRFPYPEKSVHYTYRFQVPDSQNYDVSWTDFSSEKLENYPWNGVDLYICAQGEGDYGLIKSYKYWSARFFLLPINIPATKKIIEGHERCDIYEESFLYRQQTKLISGFLNFVESLNKIKTLKGGRKGQTPVRRTSVPISPGCGSLAASDLSDPVKGLEANSSRARAIPRSDLSPASTHPSPKGILNATEPKVYGSSYIKTPESNLIKKDKHNLPENLSTSSPVEDIIEAILHPTEGINFLSEQRNSPVALLPKRPFISAEAVDWAQKTINDISTKDEAVSFFQKMIEDDVICHASGDRCKPFIFGFYIYFVTAEKKESLQPNFHTGYVNTTFQFEWCEVAFHYTSEKLYKPEFPLFLMSELPSKKFNTAVTGALDFSQRPHMPPQLSAPSNASPAHKRVYADVDATRKSERSEWGTASYHGNYNPMCAFEFEVQWLVATGCILAELVKIWSHKASNYGFQFVPVPTDPFALPFTPNSDPLRGPIFVQLDVDCLKNEMHNDLFHEFSPETRTERLFLLQDFILKRFGFMPDRFRASQLIEKTHYEDYQAQYIHCTGGMSAMIPDINAIYPRNLDGTHRQLPTGSYKDYIVRQQLKSNCESDGYYLDSSGVYKIGFLWSWNFMLAKKNSHTGDEHFQDKMLLDFRSVCSNKQNRLRQLYDECFSTAQAELSRVAE